MGFKKVSYLDAVHKNTKRQFLVAFHDVCPENCEWIATELALLESLGVTTCALGVIPHAEGESIPKFRAQLLRWQDQGYEFLLHGYRHQANVDSPRSLGGRMALRMTGGQAEFAGLSEGQSAKLLEEAIRSWDRLGLGRALGFVPPTWHANSQLPFQALQVGWSVYEARFSLMVQGSPVPQNIFSIPASFAGLGPMSGALARKLAKYVVPHLPGIPRLVFHPGELSGVNGPVLQGLVRSWLAWGNPVRYGSLLAKPA